MVSHAMISDSIHSLSDVMTTIVVMIGVHFSSMPSDHEHPYGHERMECDCSHDFIYFTYFYWFTNWLQ